MNTYKHSEGEEWRDQIVSFCIETIFQKVRRKFFFSEFGVDEAKRKVDENPSSQ